MVDIERRFDLNLKIKPETKVKLIFLLICLAMELI